MIGNTTSLDGIAVIGMSGRFPMAPTLDVFWHNLCNGVESVLPLSDESLLAMGVDAAVVNDPNYVKASLPLEDSELFDATFFGYSPREAAELDPQHRLFLECAWEALEHAGYDPSRANGTIGVCGSAGMSSYFFANIYPHYGADVGRAGLDLGTLLQNMIGNDKDYLATRVSFKLNLKGPSFTAQTACSSSLTAIHLACQSLLMGESDIMLAGGVSIKVPQGLGYFHQEGGMTSPDGHCRAFDANASGTVFGNGVGIVVLKRLEDALADGDQIYAVIKGSAINNDGALKAGFTAPSVEAQAEVVAEALAVAGFEPETITYIEAHGTGTELGDPIEIAALTQAFRTGTQKPQFCGIGSVKSNIGHLDTAAGIANFIKATLAIHHKQLPPSINFERPNPKLDIESSPFYINTALAEWETEQLPRRAGVSSLGVGGTNVHVIVEEAPPIADSGPTRPWQLLTLSAHTNTALEATTDNLARCLRAQPDLPLADVSYTLNLGRQAFPLRRMLVCENNDDAVAALGERAPKRVLTQLADGIERPVVFMFSGQGSQYVGMGQDLYQTEPIFREQIDQCADILRPYLDSDLRDVLYPATGATETAIQRLNQTSITQPALFAVEYALARLWMAWGIQPQAMIGHSIGEYVAACLAEVLSLEDALALVVARGRLMQQMPKGAMLSIPLPVDTIAPQLAGQLDIAAINEPASCVISGPTDAVAAFEQQLSADGVTCRRMHVSHAFHSAMMDPMLQSFVAQVRNVQRHPPKIPYVSNVTGTWVTAAEIQDPAYWARQLRQTVQFADGIHELVQDMECVLLEVGPGRALATSARRQTVKTPQPIILSSLRHPQDVESDSAFLLTTLGKLWLAGVSVDWPGFYTNERRRRVALPTYPFERKRYWIDPPRHASNGVSSRVVEVESLAMPELQSPSEPEQRYDRPNLPHAYVAPRNQAEQTLAAIWQEVLGITEVGIHDNFFDLGGDSVIGVRVAAKANDYGLRMTPKQLFEHTTIAELAPAVQASKGVQAEQGVVTGPLALTPIQHWFFEQNHARPERFGIPIPLKSLQPLDPRILEQALQYLIDHHDALRLRYTYDGRTWSQFNDDLGESISLLQLDFSTLAPDEQPEALLQLEDTLQDQLDLANGPLLKAALVTMGPDTPDHLLILLHHLAWDIGTERILLEDLRTVYQQLSDNKVVQLPTKTTSFKQWSDEVNTFAQSSIIQQELNYWCSAAHQQVSHLRMDYPDGVFAPDSTDMITESLSVEETQALMQNVQQAYRTKIDEVLLAGLLHGFCEWTGNPSLLIDMDGHGREISLRGIDLSRTIGWFTTSFPLLLELGTASTPSQLLKSVKEQLRSIPHEGLGYGLLRYNFPDEDIRQRVRDLPQADVFFYYLGQQVIPEMTYFTYDERFQRENLNRRGTQSYTLEIRSSLQDKLQISWIYSKNQYRPETIQNLAHHVMEVIRSIIFHCQSPEVGSYTPSDFPAAEVSQAELDAVLAEFEGVIEGAINDEHK